MFRGELGPAAGQAAELVLARPDQAVWALALLRAARDAPEREAVRRRVRCLARANHLLWLLRAPEMGL